MFKSKYLMCYLKYGFFYSLFIINSILSMEAVKIDTLEIFNKLLDKEAITSQDIENLKLTAEELGQLYNNSLLL